MTELNKRIITSLVLISSLYLSIINNFILFIFLLIIYYQLFYEFYSILKKTHIINNLLIFIFILNIILIYLFILNLSIFQIFMEDNFSKKIFLLMTILICIFSDIGGFVFGKLLKGKKLTKISPNKTYSGVYGAYIISLIFTYLLFKNSFTNLQILICVFFVSTVSQMGDLFISYLKRKAKIKDTGNFLPGHGGLLDRLDGIIFALPIGLYLNNIL